MQAAVLNIRKEQIKMNYLERIEELMDQGMDEDTACRIADSEFNPNYDPDDYDDPMGYNKHWNTEFHHELICEQSACG